MSYDELIKQHVTTQNVSPMYTRLTQTHSSSHRPSNSVKQEHNHDHYMKTEHGNNNHHIKTENRNNPPIKTEHQHNYNAPVKTERRSTPEIIAKDDPPHMASKPSIDNVGVIENPWLASPIQTPETHSTSTNNKKHKAQTKPKKSANSKPKNKARKKGNLENASKRWTEAHDKSLLKWMRKNRNDLRNDSRIYGKANHLGRSTIALTARINHLKKSMDNPPQSVKKKKKSKKAKTEQKDTNSDCSDDDDEWIPSDNEVQINTNNKNKTQMTKQQKKQERRLVQEKHKNQKKQKKHVLGLLNKLSQIHELQFHGIKRMKIILSEGRWQGDIMELSGLIGCDVNALQSQWDIMKNCADIDIIGEKVIKSNKKLATKKRKVVQVLQAEDVHQPNAKRRRMSDS
eukprot:93758_1